MKCNCLVYHPVQGSAEWQSVLSNYRQTADHGDGALLPILAEQLFGLCNANATEIKPTNERVKNA